MDILSNFSVVQQFNAVIYGKVITSKQTYNHVYWIAECLMEYGYFNDDKAKDFDIASFFADYIEAFERFERKADAFCLSDFENDVYNIISDNETHNFKDLRFELYLSYSFSHLNEQLRLGRYFNKKQV